MLVQMSKEALIPSPAVYGSSRLTADLDDIHVESLATSIARHEHHGGAGLGRASVRVHTGNERASGVDQPRVVA